MSGPGSADDARGRLDGARPAAGDGLRPTASGGRVDDPREVAGDGRVPADDAGGRGDVPHARAGDGRVPTDDDRDPAGALPERERSVEEWTRLVPAVPSEWFLYPERAAGIHGAGHIRRVCVHTLRLSDALGLPDRPRRLALTAALWHDIGRTHDGVEPEHGERSARRVRRLGLADWPLPAGRLSPAELETVLFAVHYHSLDDAAARRAAERLRVDPRHAAGTTPRAANVADVAGGAARSATDADPLDLLWLLKDADALDRVRLGLGGDVDSRYFRHACTTRLVDFAWELYAALLR